MARLELAEQAGQGVGRPEDPGVLEDERDRPGSRRPLAAGDEPEERQDEQRGADQGRDFPAQARSFLSGRVFRTWGALTQARRAVATPSAIQSRFSR